MKAAFITDLVAKLVKDGTEELWELVQPLTFRSNELKCQFTVPVGFRTNFCSVPRLPFVYWMLGNRARRAGTCHDYIYSVKLFSRRDCDLMLREMVQLCGANKDEAQQFYLAVRAAGGSHYGHQG